MRCTSKRLKWQRRCVMLLRCLISLPDTRWHLVHSMLLPLTVNTQDSQTPHHVKYQRPSGVSQRNQTFQQHDTPSLNNCVVTLHNFLYLWLFLIHGQIQGCHGVWMNPCQHFYFIIILFFLQCLIVTICGFAYKLMIYIYKDE